MLCRMYVCICKAITEKDIAVAVENGVRSMRQLRLATQCASQCGRCASFARATMNEALEAESAKSPLAFNVAIVAQ